MVLLKKNYLKLVFWHFRSKFLVDKMTQKILKQILRESFFYKKLGPDMDNLFTIILRYFFLVYIYFWQLPFSAWSKIILDNWF